MRQELRASHRCCSYYCMRWDEQLVEERRLRDEEKHRQRAEREGTQNLFNLLRGVVDVCGSRAILLQLMQKKARKERCKWQNLWICIEAYLERRLKVYDIEKPRWALKLALQSSGRAQQAYVDMDAKELSDYNE